MEESRPIRQQYPREEQAPQPAPASGEARQVPQSNRDENELLTQTAAGDRGAQHELVQRHAAYLYGVAHALSGGNQADAEDLVQETFMGALKTRFRGEASIRTWLVRILVRQAGMLRRGRARKKTISLDAPAASTSRGQETALASVGTSGGAGAADARLDLSHMLQQLSPEHRQVIILRELQGLRYEQIAQVLHVPRGTVESRLHRAREDLRKRFAGYLEE